MIKGKSLEEVKNSILHIENIKKGMDNYSNICVCSEYEKYKDFIKKFLDNCDTAYFDFYFNEIEEDEKNNFLRKVSNKDILEKFDFEKGKIYFDAKKIDEEILELIFKISYDSLLFSTFYINEPKITLWTSYEKKVIIFLEDTSYFEKVKETLLKLEMEIIFEEDKGNL